MKTIILCCAVLFCTSLSANTFYVDPVNGNMNNDGSINAPWTTLQDLHDNAIIQSFEPAVYPHLPGQPLQPKNVGAPVQPGDTIYCFSGYQGDFDIAYYYNLSYIHVIGLPGHQAEFSSISIRGSSHWAFENLTISKSFSGTFDGGPLFYLITHPTQNPVYDIELKNSTLYTIWDAYPWTAADWRDQVSHGIYNSYEVQNLHYYNNYIRNTGMAIQVMASDALVEENTIENFSGDGIRVNGDRIHVYYNTVMNAYDVGDANHDDLIQSFNLGTGTYDDCHLVGNLLIGSNDPNQPAALLSDPQGIGMFDGFYEGWVISNNVIAVNHWHGLTLMGARNCIISNNTLTKIDIAHPYSPWIRIVAHKNGTPSVNNTVTNNTYFHSVTNQDGPTSNNIRLNTAAQYDQHFVDWQNNDFHLLVSSTLIDAGTNVGAPNIDKDSVSRPLGQAIDIGAYEYGSVNEDCNLTVSSNVNDVGCNAQDGEILLAVTGGLPGYNFQWSNGLNSRNITGLSVGTYTVSITDANDCSIRLSFEVELNCCPSSANPCVDAIQGTLNICSAIANDPNLPLGAMDCDGDGVTNADECTDNTNPLDLCDYLDISITQPVIADQSSCPQPCSDLTPTTTVIPSTISGNSAVEVAVVISEIEGIDTDGTTISVRVPSDPRLVFIWDVGLTQVAGVPVQNSDWNYLGSNGVFSTWTYNGNGQIINANSSAALGFQAFYDPQNTDGQTTITSTIVPFSGGDCNLFNNTDSEILIYFK